MKAIVSNKYGSPDVLEFKDVDKHLPKDDQVLVRIHAASVNPLDWHFMRGEPRLMRLGSGLINPRIKILGADFAGIVESVGGKVEEFHVGDEVFGTTAALGAFAEHICAKEEDMAMKPAQISYGDAAAIPVAGLTALQAVRDSAKVQPGHKVLINGAAGGVGTFAVQIAKSFGAVVTGVCSAQNLEKVKSIGADVVIDYAKEDFTRIESGYDVIIDNVGNRSVSDYRRALNATGNCVIVGYTSPSLLIQHAVMGPLRSRKGHRRVGLMGTAQSRKEDILFLTELVESGKVKPVIDRSYPLKETADAVRYLETGHAKAKVIITML